MNLLELKEIYEEKQQFIKWKMEEIRLIDCKMENIKATDIKDISVQSSYKKIDLADLLDKKVILEQEVEELGEELNKIIPVIKELEHLYSSVGDRDKQIYIQRKIWGYSPVKIGIKWGITDRQVQKIVKKVEKQLSSSQKFASSMKK